MGQINKKQMLIIVLDEKLARYVMSHYFFKLTHFRGQGRNTKKCLFLVQMKTLKFASENYWLLVCSQMGIFTRQFEIQQLGLTFFLLFPTRMTQWGQNFYDIKFDVIWCDIFKFNLTEHLGYSQPNHYHAKSSFQRLVVTT